MNMTVLNNLLSPISVAFIVIIIGYFIGRIKFGKVSLDLSGVLIVAVIVGWLLALITSRRSIVDMTEFESNMKFFSAFGTALFVSSIGISTGSMIDFQQRKDIKAILVGSLMVASAFVTMKVIPLVDKNITVSKLLGSLCGALTTTPGLSAACELENIVTEDVVLGYGCTYLFGVIATVLFVQISTLKFNFVYEDNKKAQCNDNKAALYGLIQIASAIVLGGFLGNIKILGFSLGISGGTLCAGLIIGLFVKKISPSKVLTTKILSPFRNTGLVLFFVGNGIPAGAQISKGFDIKMILYGVLMTIIPIVFGTFLYKILFTDRLAAPTIAGGMTSTPAIGVLTEKNSNISLNKYTLAYFGALITIVLLIRLVEIQV